MSSTNVHSKGKYVVGGQTIPQPDKKGEVLKMPPDASGKGPTLLNVIEGSSAQIAAFDNIVVKDKKKVVGRADKNGNVLSGDSKKVKEALANRDNISERE